MELEIYQIDTFTDSIFGGNPACVVRLEEWLSDGTLLKIAGENGVAETAFFIDRGDTYRLRWFTPETEMDLCGHATLATAHVLRNHLDCMDERITFDTSSGKLNVTFEDDLIVLDLPAWKPEPINMLPIEIANSLNILPITVLKSRDYLLVYKTEEEIKTLKVDRRSFHSETYALGNIIATSPGAEVDFVSRFFSPSSSIFEDPVTGSAHCTLVPYWSEKLAKKRLSALQLSDRRGELFCVNNGKTVSIGGRAITYSLGNIFIGGLVIG